MKCAVIDIGSNSMRLTVYEAEKNNFKILFKEKIMAGLAGFVNNNVLTADGIDRACEGLLEFKSLLELLQIESVSVFATASLRNISNTDEAISVICAATGFIVEVVKGEDEALYGYTGAMLEINMPNGIFIDIGGASTEITMFDDGRPMSAASFGIGSLKLYRDCVKKILPSREARGRMKKQIREEISLDAFSSFNKSKKAVCAGGTARAVLKLAQRVFNLPKDSCTITSKQFNRLCDILFKADSDAVNLMLKTEPERLNTLIPGMMILKYIIRSFKVKELIVTKYGVREGYLCTRIQKSIQAD